MASVKVKIENANGAFIEQGDAIMQSDGFNWLYRVTTAGSNAGGNKVTIIAADLPGNIIVDEKKN